MSSASASGHRATSTPRPARFSTVPTSAGRTLRSATRSARSSAFPVFVGNDARCATLGEYTFGTGKATQDFVLLTLGTGIGGGIVAGGELLLGHRWGAGEIGHHQIRPHDGFVCGCGKIGCFEAQASGTGLIRHAFAVAPSFPRSSCSTLRAISSARRRFAVRRRPAIITRSLRGRTSSAISRSASPTSSRSSIRT